MGAGGERRLCMGVDVEEGGPGGPRARFSVAVVDSEGRLVHKAQGAPLSRVVRLAWDYRPDCIAVDNVFELASNARDLARIAALLPPGTRIVQVTARPEGGFEGLESVARRVGVELESKPTPARTAYLVALAAVLGEGAEVRFREEKTIITVARGRAPKGGGMSHDRYLRRVRASVMRAARKIEEALERAGLDFDVTIRKGEGGYESAVFTVYAPREALEGVVRPHRGLDYVVTVKPVYGPGITIGGREPGQSQRPVILGVDPGITTGVAVLDLDGRILYLGSGKGLDRSSIIQLVKDYGRPVVVAVDTKDPPDSVRKLAGQLNAALYTPPSDLSVAEKSEIAQRLLGRLPSSTHERDALAAAYKAWVQVKGKLDRIASYLGRIGIEDIDEEWVRESVIRGLTLAEAVEREIERVISSWMEAARGDATQRQAVQERRSAAPADYAARLQALEAEKYALERALEERERRIRELEEELESVRRRARAEAEARIGGELEALRARVELLEAEIDRLRRELEEREDEVKRAVRLILEASDGGLVAARVLPSLTLSNIRSEERRRGPFQPGDVVYIVNPGSYERAAAEELARTGVAAVLLDETGRGLADVLERLGVPVFRLSDYLKDTFRGLVLVDARVRVDAARRREELEAEREASLDLERLVEEYRRERARRLRSRGR